MVIKEQATKTLKTRDNGRSSDAVSPNFILGCLGGCMSSYCYVGRHHHDRVFVNTNISQILMSISDWVEDKPWPKIPNQTDPTYYTIDIGCSTDVPLMHKHYDWNRVFRFFNDDPMLKSTFATKYPSMFKPEWYNLKKDKHRIRVSLMPQVYSDVLEPKTDSITTRIDQIARLQEYMEVHVNLSPIIYNDGWLTEYDRLLYQLAASKGADQLKFECIFLTYNELQQQRNSDEVNALCWRPDIQERKDSNYADNNIRYQWQFKDKLKREFLEVFRKYFNLETIRYIF